MPSLFDPLKVGALDLPNRIVMAPLNPWDTSTFYSGGAKGYTDYPARTTELA